MSHTSQACDRAILEKTGRCCQPCVVVIFGASGDLTHRKLIPALYNLASRGMLPERFAIVGFGRHAVDSAGFRARMSESIQRFATTKVRPEVWQWIVDRLHFVTGEYDDAAAHARLAATLDEVDRDHGTMGNRLFYLATPPELFEPIARRLVDSRVVVETGDAWRRLIIEKPFGRDLASARRLNATLGEILKERQIYRIDHYLGKETVQNILAFRFGNGIFEPLWNHRYIQHVRITAAETVGVENRASYYETAGALRDMISNHVLQLLALIAMEPPISLEADAIRNEKARVLSSIRPFADSVDVDRRAVRGQYVASSAAGLAGYRQEPGVAPDSRVETYAALKVLLDNWRWSGVPFYLCTGKRLARRSTEIVIQFKRPPHLLFAEQQSGALAPNTLTIQIQPEEGISLRFGAKIPGASLRLGDVNMAFNYRDNFGSEPSTGYETLLFDGMCGDQTLFHRADGVELGWRAMDPVLARWAQPDAPEPSPYEAGSTGPAKADELMAG